MQVIMPKDTSLAISADRGQCGPNVEAAGVFGKSLHVREGSTSRELNLTMTTGTVTITGKDTTGSRVLRGSASTSAI
jgi:hypothetical protein